MVHVFKRRQILKPVARQVDDGQVRAATAEDFGQDSTIVLDRAARPQAAAAVGRALGTDWVESQPDANLYLDVTVLLGSGWLPDVPVDEGEGEEAPWWDVRRFLR